MDREVKSISGANVTPGAVFRDLPIMGSTGNTPGHMRAFDKRSGKLLWHATLPTAGLATLATYEVKGRQYVVIAAGGGKNTEAATAARIVAYALPVKDANQVVATFLSKRVRGGLMATARMQDAAHLHVRHGHLAPA
jgi:hypothetical protein